MNSLNAVKKMINGLLFMQKWTMLVRNYPARYDERPKESVQPAGKV